MPKLLLIQATGYSRRDVRVPYRFPKRKLVGAVLPYMAALAPKHWEVSVIDDATERVDYNTRADVVGIAVRTVTSLRAYEIADEFRRRGVKVLLGGPHMTFFHEEAAPHADGICVGEGEEIFPRMLEDAAAGRLQKFYRRDRPADLRGMPAPRWDLLDPKKYVFYRPYVILHSRGCPFTCDFCAERRLSGDYGWRVRPTEEIVDDVKRCGSRHIFFAASQFSGDKTKAMELMEALIPLKVRWSTLFSAHFCMDEKFMDLARRSGLLHVNTGAESIDQRTLRGMNKNFNKAHEFVHMIGNLRRRDISFSLNFVFGTDTDDESVFPATMEFLEEHKVPAAYFNILVPLRGTGVYEKMKAEGRIIDEENLERWPGLSCHFKPLRFTPQGLLERVAKIRREFYSLRSTVRRLPIPYRESHFASWNVNLLQMKVARNLDKMRDFSEF